MGEGYSGFENRVPAIENLETEFDSRINQIIKNMHEAMEEFKKARDLYHVAQTDGTSLEVRAKLEIDLNNKTMAVHRLWDAVDKVRAGLDMESRLN